jgi:hypothetical protein
MRHLEHHHHHHWHTDRTYVLLSTSNLTTRTGLRRLRVRGSLDWLHRREEQDLLDV